MNADTTSTKTFLTPDALLGHWQGHRRLTRRTTEAFPADQLFSFTPVPSMRPFGAMVLEVIHMIEPTLDGLVGGQWATPEFWEALQKGPTPTKADLLGAWDEADRFIAERWPQIPAGRFYQVEAPFGLPPTPLRDLVLYQIDNEIHHRAQGFVYLRLLGLEPPAFYER